MTSTRAIPPDFFQSIHNRDHHADLSYSIHRHKLNTALGIAANNRWVADWLFQDIQSPFHRNITIPPEAFDKSLPIQVMHHFFDVQVDACPFMRMRHPSGSPTPSSLFHTKGADMLLLPVACADGITVGYSFGSLRNPAPSQTRTDIFCGRFAFEMQREELIVISNGDQPGVPDHSEKLMVIMSFLWTSEAVREHYMILCPLREYSYYNLPNEVLFFTSAEMRNPSKHPVPLDIQALQSLFSSENSLDVIDELLLTSPDTILSPESLTPPLESPEELCNLPPTSSDLPWFLDNNGKPKDNVGIPRRPGDLQTSSGVFNMDALSESLASIERSLRGDFYGSRQSSELIHPEVQAHPVKTPGMHSARNVVARISRSNASEGSCLRQVAIRLYLSNVLPVMSDQQFIHQSKHIGTGTAQIISNTTQDQLSGRKARRIAPLTIAVSSGESDNKVTSREEEEKKREEKREAKRRRNRLSAARSNEKRRENWQMKQRTLESLRNRVQELEQRKITLSRENEYLKEQVTAVLK